MAGDPIHDRIIELLTLRGVSFRIHEHAVAPTVADATARLPFPTERFLKTVAFRIKDGPWVLAALRGQDRVDYRKLADAFGVRRGDLVRPTLEEIAAALGFPFGGVCPIPPNGEAQTVVDSDALGMETVYCGIGSNNRTLEIGLQDLIEVAGARVLAIAQR